MKLETIVPTEILLFPYSPLWIASLASAAILFIAVSKLPIANRKENLAAKVVQVLMGAIVSLVVGFGLTWLAEGMVGLNIPGFLDTNFIFSTYFIQLHPNDFSCSFNCGD